MLEDGVFHNGFFQGGRAGRRHQLHSKLLEEESSASKTQSTYAFSGPLCADPHARDILSVCKNHHWGPLVFLCRPEALSVSYHIGNEYFPKFWRNFPNNGIVDGQMMLDRASTEERKSASRFIDLKIKYKRIGGPDSGWYEGGVKITAGEASCNTDRFLTFVAVMTVVLSLRLIVDAVGWLLLTPWFLYKVWSIRRRNEEASELDIWRAVQYHADPSQSRLRQVASDARTVANGSLLVEVYLENAIALLLITAKLWSFYTCTFVRTTWQWGSDGLPKTGANGENSKATMYQICAGNPWGFFVEGGWTFGGELQRTALVLIIVRLNLSVRKMQTFVWWPAVLVTAMGKMASFFVFFTSMLLSWALYLHLAFGDTFMAFYSISKSLETLIFYTFGLADPHYYHLHHNEERRAWTLTAWLTAFQIVVATIGINFFMAIVLSAYDKVLSHPPEEHDVIIAETLIDAGQSLMFALFPFLRKRGVRRLQSSAFVSTLSQRKQDRKHKLFQHSRESAAEEQEEPLLHKSKEGEAASQEEQAPQAGDSY